MTSDVNKTSGLVLFILNSIRIAKLASAADDRLNDVIGVMVVSLANQIQQQQQVQQNSANSHV